MVADTRVGTHRHLANLRHPMVPGTFTVALEPMPASAAPRSAIQPEKRGAAGTAGVYLLTALALPGLYLRGAALRCMKSRVTPLCRSSHGAGCSQWHRPVAALRPDTRPEIPLAGPASRRLRAGTPYRHPASVRAG